MIAIIRLASLLSLLSVVLALPTDGSANPTSPSGKSTSSLSPEWTAAYAKATATLAKLSLKDKVNLATGVGWMKGPCVGNTPAISSINYPGLCLQDSPLGVRLADKVSAFPPGINAAATFNRTLMQQRGAAMGAEFKTKGVNVALGPAMNMMRTAAGGRGWESFGGDPYLSGEAAFETITGIQSAGVQACAKHYINNEQEHFRGDSSSNVQDRAEHEIYALPFLRSVQANVASMMCSYNQVNGTYACENDPTLNGILKGELGFPGYVMSDWWATHSTGSAAKGLDMTMPGDISSSNGGSYFGSALVNAVNSGSVPKSRVDDMATRILAAWYLTGQDSNFPSTNFNSWNSNAGQHVNAQADHANLIRTIGAASTVLLKNDGGLLPLKSPHTIAVIGSHAGSASGGPNQFGDRGGNAGVLAMGWGSGTAQFPYLVAPSDAITTRAQQDGTTVKKYLKDDTGGASSAATGADVAFVFITSDSGEDYITVNGNEGDRNNLDPWDNGNALVAAVAKVNKNVVVVINSVGAVNVEPWIGNANVKAVVYAGLPGQEAGNSLVDVLYGAYNPSGRLPFTFGKSVNDYAAQVTFSGQSIVPINYNEGLLIDYRHFDSANIQPRFEFGFGLSYTTFDYQSLSVSGSVGSGTPPSGPGSALDPWLHQSVVQVTFTLTNNGTLAGTEVPQLYITLPDSAKAPPKMLKGFDAVYLGAGQAQTVTFSLSRFDLSIWNSATQRYEPQTGTIGISVGSSSRNIRLTGSL